MLETDTTAAPSSSRGDIARRTVLTTAAWAVPAVALTTASPAFAVSGARLTSISVPNNCVPAAGATTVTVTVANDSGAPVAGQTVSFAGPSGAVFSPTTTTTDSSGTATTSFDLNKRWASPGSTTTITATVNGASQSATPTVLGANALVFGQNHTSTPTQIELVFPSPIVTMTSGIDLSTEGSTFFALALLQNGTVWAKGSNQYGQLGDGTTTNRSTWAQISGLSSVTQIAAGQQTVVALQSDGTVWNWGKISRNGGPVDVSRPVQVSGLSGVTQIAVAPGLQAQYPAASFALLSDGSVKAWGTNTNGMTGTDAGSNNPWTPTQVTGLTSGVKSIGAGGVHGGAVLSDGSVRTWGWNRNGQLADGSTTDREGPVSAQGLTTSATLFAGGFFCSFAAQADGSLRSTGAGTYNARSGPSLTFQGVPELTSGVSRVSLNCDAGYALMNDGSVRTWGNNNNGQLGDGTTTSRSTPTALTTIPSGVTVTGFADNGKSARTMYLITGTS